jgi:hypothetical protein
MFVFGKLTFVVFFVFLFVLLTMKFRGTGTGLHKRLQWSW